MTESFVKIVNPLTTNIPHQIIDWFLYDRGTSVVIGLKAKSLDICKDPGYAFTIITGWVA